MTLIPKSFMPASLSLAYIQDSMQDFHNEVELHLGHGSLDGNYRHAGPFFNKQEFLLSLIRVWEREQMWILNFRWLCDFMCNKPLKALVFVFHLRQIIVDDSHFMDYGISNLLCGYSCNLVRVPRHLLLFWQRIWRMYLSIDESSIICSTARLFTVQRHALG